MKNETWFQSIILDPLISAIVPMELQPEMPLPLICGNQLLFYVPFYRVQPGDEKVEYSDVQMEICFSAVTKRIISVKDLRVLEGVSGELLHEADYPTDERIQEQALICEDLFHQLDKIEAAYRQTKSVPPQKLAHYTGRLLDSLLYPELSRYYNEVQV